MRGILLVAVLLALTIVAYLNLTATKELAGSAPSAVRNSPKEVEKEIQRLTDEHMKRLEDANR